MVHLFIKTIEIGILVSVVSTVWEDTDGCSKKYRCVLDIYLMTVLSYLYGTIIYYKIDSPGHRDDVFDVLNDTAKQYLSE